MSQGSPELVLEYTIVRTLILLQKPLDSADEFTQKILATIGVIPGLIKRGEDGLEITPQLSDAVIRYIEANRLEHKANLRHLSLLKGGKTD